MTLRLVWVNHEQLAFEREMRAWLAWIVCENRCIACEAPRAEHTDRFGYPLCDDCGTDDGSDCTNGPHEAA